MMTQPGTENVFNRSAASYNSERARLIPGYDQFHGAALDLIPPSADYILDLGTGTGLFAAMIRERLPEACLDLIDNSEPMLAQARQRFAQDQEARCQLADYTTAPWGSQYDAIVSALFIHHLPDAAKRHLFQRVQRALKSGGVFINAEQILAPTPDLETAAKADWLAQVRALGATAEQIEASLLRQTEDRCSTIADQLQWLGEAGFSVVSCPYRGGRFAVLYARV